jgi:isopenicillin N synthase-like dioxygenase
MLLYTPPVASALPVIDLAPSLSGEEHGRNEVAGEIYKASRDTGFFYVANHGVPADLMAAALEVSKEFFELPLETKRALSISADSKRGYEGVATSAHDNGSPGDLHEAFRCCGDFGLPNRWPAALPRFRRTMLAYHRALCEAGARIATLIATSLDLPPEYFVEPYAGANPTLRALHYPPHPKTAAFNQLGIGAHTDYGGITLLLQDDCGGLEVQGAQGTWIDARPIAGTLVVNIGDMMARWTNDMYNSTLHRVKNGGTGLDRYSIAFFFSPPAHTRVVCLPTCVPSGEQPKYPPCTAGEHIQERFRSTYGYR